MFTHANVNVFVSFPLLIPHYALRSFLSHLFAIPTSSLSLFYINCGLYFGSLFFFLFLILYSSGDQSSSSWLPLRHWYFSSCHFYLFILFFNCICLVWPFGFCFIFMRVILGYIYLEILSSTTTVRGVCSQCSYQIWVGSLAKNDTCQCRSPDHT